MAEDPIARQIYEQMAEADNEQLQPDDDESDAEQETEGSEQEQTSGEAEQAQSEQEEAEDADPHRAQREAFFQTKYQRAREDLSTVLGMLDEAGVDLDNLPRKVAERPAGTQQQPPIPQTRTDEYGNEVPLTATELNRILQERDQSRDLAQYQQQMQDAIARDRRVALAAIKKAHEAFGVTNTDDLNLDPDVRKALMVQGFDPMNMQPTIYARMYAKELQYRTLENLHRSGLDQVTAATQAKLEKAKAIGQPRSAAAGEPRKESRNERLLRQMREHKAQNATYKDWYGKG